MAVRCCGVAVGPLADLAGLVVCYRRALGLELDQRFDELGEVVLRARDVSTSPTWVHNRSVVHRTFSNLKTWLKGTHHGVNSKHLPHYINEFVFRFNRRRMLAAFQSLLGLTAQHAPTT